MSGTNCHRYRIYWLDFEGFCIDSAQIRRSQQCKYKIYFTMDFLPSHLIGRWQIVFFSCVIFVVVIYSSFVLSICVYVCRIRPTLPVCHIRRWTLLEMVKMVNQIVQLDRPVAHRPFHWSWSYPPVNVALWLEKVVPKSKRFVRYVCTFNLFVLCKLN